MKKRINLFVAKKQGEIAPDFLRKTRVYGLYILPLVVISLAIAIGLQYYFSQEIEKTRTAEQVLTQYLEENKETERNVSYFAYKKQLLKKYLKDDAQFSLYYGLMENLLRQINGSPRLDIFQIDKDHKTYFIITFNQYEEANQFITKLETPIILQYFRSLKLLSFSTSQVNDGQTQYKVELEGVFNPINADTF